MADVIEEIDVAGERQGNWILTYTGKRFFLTDPRPEDVDILDIAHALSNIGRFTGHAVRFYSVAEHSLFVAKRCGQRFAAWGLLHDAAEAYVGDVSSPLKRSMQMKEFAAVEDLILRTIYARFGMHHSGAQAWIPDAVKEADLRMLMTEKRDLMPDSEHAWVDVGEPYPQIIPVYAAPNDAVEKEFLMFAKELGIE